MKSTRAILFVRHGETEYNRRHVRCGGDIDIPLTENGETQAAIAAEQLRHRAPDIDAVFLSPLLRTRRTAEIIHAGIGATCPFIVHPGLTERRLGAWNGMDIAASQPLFDAGQTPPGGETEEFFRARIGNTLADILAHSCRLPLVVASKGVARVLGILAGAGVSRPAGNAEVIRFEFTLQASSHAASLAVERTVLTKA